MITFHPFQIRRSKQAKRLAVVAVSSWQLWEENITADAAPRTSVCRRLHSTILTARKALHAVLMQIEAHNVLAGSPHADRLLSYARRPAWGKHCQSGSACVCWVSFSSEERAYYVTELWKEWLSKASCAGYRWCPRGQGGREVECLRSTSQLEQNITTQNETRRPHNKRKPDDSWPSLVGIIRAISTVGLPEVLWYREVLVYETTVSLIMPHVYLQQCVHPRNNIIVCYLLWECIISVRRMVTDQIRPRIRSSCWPW